MMSGFCAAKARVSSSVLGRSVSTFGSSSLLGSSPITRCVEGARAGEIGLGLLDVGAGARQPRLGLRHVGAGDLADLEAVAGSLQLALQALLVVERQIEHRPGPGRRRCRRRRASSSTCCSSAYSLARWRLDLVLGPAHLRLGAAAGVEVLAEGEVDALAGAILLEPSPCRMVLRSPRQIAVAANRLGR